MAKEAVVMFELPPFFYLFEDGSVKRGGLRHPILPSPQDGVAFKDVTLNAELGLWARLYLPLTPPPDPKLKLPLVLCFHGGGFIMGSPDNCHHFCIALAKHSGAIFVSPSYRLAPEHRLPCAYDDGLATLQWLRSQSLLVAEGHDEEHMDPWLAAHADFSKCFVAGESAGGNLAHRVVMMALNLQISSPNAWAPLCIRGLIPIHPGFGRRPRTQAEEESPFDPLLDWRVADMTAELSLPLGTSKNDHHFLNPLVELGARGAFSHLPPKALVALADGDRLHFMGLEYAEALKKAGCAVDVFMNEGVGHCFYVLQPNSEEANLLYSRVAKFISDESFPEREVCCKGEDKH